MGFAFNSRKVGEDCWWGRWDLIVIVGGATFQSPHFGALSWTSLREPKSHLGNSSVPGFVLKKIREHAHQIEEIIGTLEDLADQEGIRRTKNSLKEYGQHGYVVVEYPNKPESLLDD